jgi:hypothetical protein
MTAKKSTAPAAAASTIEEFLTLRGGPVVLCHLAEGAGMKGATFDLSEPVAVRRAAAWALDRNERGEQVYFSVNPPTDKILKKPTKAETGLAAFAHVEVDPDSVMKEKGIDYDTARAFLHEGLAREMAEDPNPPTVIWSSGNGISAMWRLDEAAGHGEVERLNQRLLARWGGDKGTHNVDRVLRLPGTVNHPTAKKIKKGYPATPRLAHVLHTAEASYTLEQLGAGLPEIETKSLTAAEAAPDAGPLTPEEIAALEQRFKLARETDDFLSARWDGRSKPPNDASRSGMDFSIGAMLKARGYSYREMRHLLIGWDHGGGAEKATTGDERYFQRIWDRSTSGVTPGEVIKSIHKIHTEAEDDLQTADWAPTLYDAHLDAAGVTKVIEELVHLGIGNKRPLAATFKEYAATRAAQERKDRATERVELATRGRVPVAWNPLSYRTMLPAIERSLIAQGLLRVDHTHVRIAVEAQPGTDHPENDTRPEGQKLPIPHQVATVPLGLTDMRLAIEAAVQLRRSGQKGPEPMPVPADLANMLLEFSEKEAPRIAGLVTHPILTTGGRLIEREGYDPETGLYLALGGWDFGSIPEAPTKDEAVAAAKRIREILFSEMLLKDPAVDGAALLALLLAGVARKVLPKCPAGLINATVQGTGKTTVARMLHATLTGRDMAVQTISPDTGEFRKAIVATLIRQPAMVCFDNLADGTTLDSPVLAAVITNPTYEDRVLGASRTITLPTNSLFVFTGNATSSTADLVRRLVKVDLLAKEALPHQRAFQHPDPVRWAIENRVEVIRAALTIQRAWRGKAREGTRSFGCDPAFDRLVTWPLEMIGEDGLFQKQAELAEQSPEEQAKTAILHGLGTVFGVASFNATAVIRKINGGTNQLPAPNSAEADLRDTIEGVDRKLVHSAPAFGHFLAKLTDQPPRGGLVLRRHVDRNKVTAYRVEGSEGSERQGAPPRRHRPKLSGGR